MSEACQLLHHRLSRMPRFDAAFTPESLPASGVYVMLERGERAHGTDRIVRVGTHRGARNLPQRLRKHFHKPNKDRSIFRKHVGRCLLASRRDPFLEQWNIDLSKRTERERYGKSIDISQLEAVEQEVSAYLAQNISFVVLPVERKEDRLARERGMLATVASCRLCHASEGWLGRLHENAAIRKIGLWNIQGLKGRPFSTEDIESLFETLLCTSAR